MKFLTSGSDGARTVNYEILDLSSLSLHERQEILDPIFDPHSFSNKGSKNPLTRYSQPWVHLSQEHCKKLPSAMLQEKASGSYLKFTVSLKRLLDR